MQKHRIICSPLFWITLSLPVVLLSVGAIYPTFDDWTSTPSPNPDDFSWEILLPRRSYWRPFESLFGWLLAHYRWLMPWASHLIVISAHYAGTVTLFMTASLLGLKPMARNIATIAFFVSTGAIATTTACDGMSQAWVHTLGMVALYSYLTKARQHRSSCLWLLIVIFATAVKENAICWGIAIPVVGYAFGFTDRRSSVRAVCYALSFGTIYTILHFSIPTATDYHLEEEYFDFSIVRFVRGVAMWLTFSLFPIDYIHLLHAPHRNLFYVLLSVLAILPFMGYIFSRLILSVKNVHVVGLILAAVILVSPHLLTIFSMMHVYASLGVISILIGYLCDSCNFPKPLLAAFSLFVLTSVVVNAEHCKAAYDSGELGKHLAIEAVNGVDKPVHKAFLLLVDNGETRYSSFYVLPWETFGWGGGIVWQTHHQWPEQIDECLIEGGDSHVIDHMTDSLLNDAGYDCVWVVDHSKVKTYQK